MNLCIVNQAIGGGSAAPASLAPAYGSSDALLPESESDSSSLLFSPSLSDSSCCCTHSYYFTTTYALTTTTDRWRFIASAAVFGAIAAEKTCHGRHLDHCDKRRAQPQAHLTTALGDKAQHLHD